MKALVQRVSEGSVTIADKSIASINQGLIVLVGVGNRDSEEDSRYLSEKIANLRIFADNDDKFNLSVLDIKGEILVISQFTLYASTRKGRRPSFIDAAPPDMAEQLIDTFIQFLLSAGVMRVESGRFQEHMLVEIHNDGPVTILIDSQDRHKPRH